MTKLKMPKRKYASGEKKIDFDAAATTIIERT